MDEEALGRPGEGAGDGLVHQEAAGALADEPGNEPEKRQLDLPVDPTADGVRPQVEARSTEG